MPLSSSPAPCVETDDLGLHSVIAMPSYYDIALQIWGITRMYILVRQLRGKIKCSFTWPYVG